MVTPSRVGKLKNVYIIMFSTLLCSRSSYCLDVQTLDLSSLATWRVSEIRIADYDISAASKDRGGHCGPALQHAGRAAGGGGGGSEGMEGGEAQELGAPGVRLVARWRLPAVASAGAGPGTLGAAGAGGVFGGLGQVFWGCGRLFGSVADRLRCVADCLGCVAGGCWSGVGLMFSGGFWRPVWGAVRSACGRGERQGISPWVDWTPRGGS